MRDYKLEHGIRTFLKVLRVPGASDVQVEANSGQVVLRGRLPTLAAKIRCRECCRHVAGVTQVVDATEVRGSSAA